MSHHTKEKGDLGVLKAQLDLFEKGWTVCVPLTEHAPFDLMIHKDGVSKTVQVKYVAMHRGSIQLDLRSCWADKNGVHSKSADKLRVDIACGYCPDTDECYYVDTSSFGDRVSLRIEDSKCRNRELIRWAEDYTEVPM